MLVYYFYDIYVFTANDVFRTIKLITIFINVSIVITDEYIIQNPEPYNPTAYTLI